MQQYLLTWQVVEPMHASLHLQSPKMSAKEIDTLQLNYWATFKNLEKLVRLYLPLKIS